MKLFQTMDVKCSLRAIKSSGLSKQSPEEKIRIPSVNSAAMQIPVETALVPLLRFDWFHNKVLSKFIFFTFPGRGLFFQIDLPVLIFSLTDPLIAPVILHPFRQTRLTGLVPFIFKKMFFIYLFSCVFVLQETGPGPDPSHRRAHR
jgi:hypothetical protein